MVKVYGPFMSLDASGTLADTLVASKWKGRNYIRERVIPSNPKSGPQVGRRAMMKFLAQNWAALSAAEKATWQTIADQLVASPFNAYVSENMKEWHNFNTPSQETPASKTGTTGTITTWNAEWNENRILLEVTLATLDENWGGIIFASTSTGFTPAVGNAILIPLLNTTDAYEFFWTPPSVETWYLDLQLFSDDGIPSPLEGEISAAP